jgi:hypothetical protein
VKHHQFGNGPTPQRAILGASAAASQWVPVTLFADGLALPDAFKGRANRCADRIGRRGHQGWMGILRPR